MVLPLMRRAGALLPALLPIACDPGASGDPRYETVAVQRGDVRDVVPAVGEIHQSVEMTVPVRADAQVTAILVRLGQKVRKGEVLATLAPREVSDEQGDAAADVVQARIARDIAANRYAKAAASFAGLSQLHDRGLVPNARLLAEQKDLENERLGLTAADRKVAELTARSARTRQRLDARDKLRAPCDCVVEDINIVRGQSVAPTMSDAFYLSGADDTMTLRAKVPEQDLARVQAAGTVRFAVDAAPDREFPAEITYISNRAIKDGRFTYYPIYLRFTRQDPAVRPGMTANVEFVNADSRNVLSVPIKALYFTPEKYVPMMPPFVEQVYKRARTEEDRRLALAMADGAEFGMLWREGKRKIFVLENGKPVRRLVRVGAQTADDFEAASGLDAGETVILAAKKPNP